MVRWRVLSKGAPRVAVAPNLFNTAICKQLVSTVKPYFHSSSSNISNYQSRPASKCGEETMLLLQQSRMIQEAENATGIKYHTGEDIMIARTSKLQSSFATTSTAAAAARQSFSNVHHDRNNAGSDDRIATFMIYLTTIKQGNGGETYFPALNSNIHTDPVALGLQKEYQSGNRILELDSALSLSCEKRLSEWRKLNKMMEMEEMEQENICIMEIPPSKLEIPPSSKKVENLGVGIQCEAGKAVVFEASSEYGSWHAPCCVTNGEDDKWIITFFKSPPRRFTSIMLGL